MSNTTSGTVASAQAYTDRVSFEAFVESFVTMASQDDWTTIRYALEAYAKDQEEELEGLVKSATHERKPGHHEEVALAAELVSKANSALMVFKQARNEHGADV